MEAGYRAGRQQRVDPRGWKFLGGGGVTPSPTPTIPPRGYYKVNLTGREIDNIIVRLDPSADEQGAVKLYIPTTTIPQDTAQIVNVFYVDETGYIDSLGIVVPERAGTFLADLAAEAEPQVKAAYADVTQVNSDTYLEDTSASIRADGVTPLPQVEVPVVEIMASRTGGMPVAGAQTVYAKVNKGFGLGESRAWGNDKLQIFTAEVEGDTYAIQWMVDFNVDLGTDPIVAGGIYELTTSPELSVESGWPTKFYEDGTYDTPVL